MNLILTPVYRGYDVVKKMCQAIDAHTVYPYLHILIDDDSGIDEPFPVKASVKRRILLLRRDYLGVVHKNGLGQAIQLGYDWANQPYINEGMNSVPYDYTFLVEADVIVQKDWDKKMIDMVATLPPDWLTLDVQSTDFEGKLIHPTTNTPIIGHENKNLEIMQYPDFQSTLFNNKIFESGIKFSNFCAPFDTIFGQVSTNILNGRHFRTKLISVYHYLSQSTKYLPVLESPQRSPFIVVEAIKDIIKDKVVCDLGAACGDLLMEMKKYAKEVIGMEINKQRVSEAKKRGLNVIEGDVFKDKIPDADIYYIWIEKHLFASVPQVVKKGILILGADPAIGEDIVINKLNLDGYWIDVPYNEGEKHRQWGIFRLFVTEIK